MLDNHHNDEDRIRLARDVIDGDKDRMPIVIEAPS